MIQENTSYKVSEDESKSVSSKKSKKRKTTEKSSCEAEITSKKKRKV